MADFVPCDLLLQKAYWRGNRIRVGNLITFREFNKVEKKCSVTMLTAQNNHDPGFLEKMYFS